MGLTVGGVVGLSVGEAVGEVVGLSVGAAVGLVAGAVVFTAELAIGCKDGGEVFVALGVCAIE